MCQECLHTATVAVSSVANVAPIVTWNFLKVVEWVKNKIKRSK